MRLRTSRPCPTSAAEVPMRDSPLPAASAEFGQRVLGHFLLLHAGRFRGGKILTMRVCIFAVSTVAFGK
jgi:hypothetical protein